MGKVNMQEYNKMLDAIAESIKKPKTFGPVYYRAKVTAVFPSVGSVAPPSFAFYGVNGAVGTRIPLPFKRLRLTKISSQLSVVRAVGALNQVLDHRLAVGHQPTSIDYRQDTSDYGSGTAGVNYNSNIFLDQTTFSVSAGESTFEPVDMLFTSDGFFLFVQSGGPATANGDTYTYNGMLEWEVLEI